MGLNLARKTRRHAGPSDRPVRRNVSEARDKTRPRRTVAIRFPTPFPGRIFRGATMEDSVPRRLDRGVHVTEHSLTSIIRRRYTPRGIMITISEIQESVLRLSSVEREHLALLV